MNYKSIYESIIFDQEYKKNLDWGKPRHGHPEGTVWAHINELEANLEKVKSRIDEETFWKLRILIHTHDTFKAESKRGVPISDPNSHASLARKFLAKHLALFGCEDNTLLNIVQMHDEPYALGSSGTGVITQPAWTACSTAATGTCSSCSTSSTAAPRAKSDLL